MKIRLVFVAAGLVFGGTVGAIVRVNQPQRIAILRAERPTPSSLSDGHEPLVVVEAQPNAVIKDSAGERLEYELSVRPRTEATSDVAIQYSIEFVGDDGRQMEPPRRPPPRTVPARGGHSAAITTPIAAGNGYFVMRAQVAASDGTEETLQIAETYFRVDAGTMIPVSPDEYFEKSNAHLARMP